MRSYTGEFRPAIQVPLTSSTGRWRTSSRANALDAARRFGCTDAAAVSLMEDLCADGNLELWERIQAGSYDEEAGKLTT